MKRKKIPPAALAGMVVCGAAVVYKALQLAEAGTIWLLMHLGGYGWGAAAARAPLYVCIGLCILLGVGASLWSLREENRQVPACRPAAEDPPEARQHREEQAEGGVR